MFEFFATKLQNIFKQLRRKGIVTDKDITTTMRELRIALLEADVNFRVAKEFIDKVSEKAVGIEVNKSLNPAQQVIKIVKDELVELLGSNTCWVKLEEINKILLFGLQGSGKTTTAVKLAYKMTKKGRYPLLVSADTYRPAAQQQLQVLGKKINIPVFVEGTTPIEIVCNAIKYMNKKHDSIIVDTAGRLHVDENMMHELKQLKQCLGPDETLLVVDGMTGQDAVNIVSVFEKEINLTGVILTKLDSDTRGGAALSIKAITGKPIKFIGVGENIDQLEIFHPERIAHRILGMGDVLSLIERAEETISKEEAERLHHRIISREFNMEDFLLQIKQLKKLGPLEQIMKMIPGMNTLPDTIKIDEKHLKRIEAIINSMTKQERYHPEIIDSSRRRRIAAGSGTTLQEVNQLLKQFQQIKVMFKNFSNPKKYKKWRGGEINWLLR